MLHGCTYQHAIDGLLQEERLVVWCFDAFRFFLAFLQDDRQNYLDGTEVQLTILESIQVRQCQTGHSSSPFLAEDSWELDWTDCSLLLEPVVEELEE